MGVEAIARYFARHGIGRHPLVDANVIEDAGMVGPVGEVIDAIDSIERTRPAFAAQTRKLLDGHVTAGTYGDEFREWSRKVLAVANMFEQGV